MNIGELARLSGASREIIRHYERIGVMPKPRRCASGYRTYDEEDLRRLNFIRHGRALGLDLQSIRELLALAADPHGDCGMADRIAQSHLARIEQQMAALERLATELRRLVSSCRGGPAVECRILEALFSPAPSFDDAQHRSAIARDGGPARDE